MNALPMHAIPTRRGGRRSAAITSGLLPGALLASRLIGLPASRSVPPDGLSAAAIGHPGRPADIPTLVIVVFDNSGSVVAPTGTDPTSNRFAEVGAAFALVARHGARRGHELAATLHFDTPSTGEVLAPLTRRGLLRLRAGLRPPPGIPGTSELAPSLHRARQIADAYPLHKVTLVILSDFQLLDADPAQVLSDLAAFPGAVHAVVLGAPVPDGVLPAPITVSTITPDARPGAVARALFRSLVAHRPGARIAPENASFPHPA